MHFGCDLEDTVAKSINRKLMDSTVVTVGSELVALGNLFLSFSSLPLTFFERYSFQNCKVNEKLVQEASELGCFTYIVFDAVTFEISDYHIVTVGFKDNQSDVTLLHNMLCHKILPYVTQAASSDKYTQVYMDMIMRYHLDSNYIKLVHQE